MWTRVRKRPRSSAIVAALTAAGVDKVSGHYARAELAGRSAVARLREDS